MDGWIFRLIIFLPFYVFGLLPLILEISHYFKYFFLLSYSFLIFQYISWHWNYHLKLPHSSDMLCFIFKIPFSVWIVSKVSLASVCYVCWSLLCHVQSADELTSSKQGSSFYIFSINLWFLFIFCLFALQAYYVLF